MQCCTRESACGVNRTREDTVIAVAMRLCAAQRASLLFCNSSAADLLPQPVTMAPVLLTLSLLSSLSPCFP
jgi:hypothetical protein